MVFQTIPNYSKGILPYWKAIHFHHVWGGGVGIMVASAFLQFDIFVANNNFTNPLQESKFSHHVRRDTQR